MHEVHALKALFRGAANEGQQRNAVAALNKFCGQGRSSFWPADPHATAFGEGKRFVWLQLLGAVNMTEAQMQQLSKTSGQPSKEGP